MTDWLGWIATGVFTLSYLARTPTQLRCLQMLGALLWLVYGLAIAAPPVMVANGLILVVAACTTLQLHRRRPPASGSARPT